MNVVLPTMGNTESFMQLVDMHCPTPCITLLGLESDNKYASSDIVQHETEALNLPKRPPLIVVEETPSILTTLPLAW